MKKYICWDQDSVNVVMNTEAEVIEPYVFAAVHRPVKMTRGATINSEGRIYTQDELLSDFLSPTKEDMFVPILGPSGSGKSHLVHWLHVHMPTNFKGKEVVLIPKAKTNLKDVIELILRNRKGEVFDKYRERLSSSVNKLDDDAGSTLLLNALAHQITHLSLDFFLEKKEIGNPKLLDSVKKSLPNLLYDPYFRDTFWLKEDGVIHRLYDLALGNSRTRRRMDSSLEFSESDLPTDIEDIAKAGEAARLAAKTLRSPQVQEMVIVLLNLGLSEAIKMLLLGGEDLTQIMLDVRRELYQHDTTLILLIEDFAKIQGIDRALLEAITLRSSHEDQLCSIRTALACTDGYFGNVPDTIRTRASFYIHITYNKEERENYDSFVAHYLNAARVGINLLKSHFKEAQTASESSEFTLNACEDCPYRENCHATFGAYRGIGLYPFNTFSAKNMYESLGGNYFNPRLFIGQVLREVMDKFAPDIKKGEFPNKALHDAFGGQSTKLNARKTIEIESKVGKEKSLQIIPLVEYWSDTDNRLAQGIYEAFDLPYIEDGNTKIPSIPPAPLPSPSPPTAPQKKAYPEEFNQLENWRNGNRISQRENNNIRNLLYDSIINYIDWDDIGLLKSEFTGTSKVFNKESIILDKRQTNSWVKLILPLQEEERTSTAQALQGMVLFVHFKHWEFEDAKYYFISFSNYLETWSQMVINQIFEFSRSEDNSTKTFQWNPVQSIIQQLYIESRAYGTISHDDTSLVEIWNKLHDMPTEVLLEYRNTNWKKYLDYKLNHEKLLDLLFSHTLCTKGEKKTSAKYFDIVKVIPVIKEIHEKFKGELLYNTPVNTPKTYQALIKKEEYFISQFQSGVDQELFSFSTWHTFIINSLGQDVDDIKENFKTLLNDLSEIEDSGLTHVGRAYDQLRHNLSKITSQKLEQACRNSYQLQELIKDKENNYSKILSRLGRSDMLQVMHASKDAIEKTINFLDGVEKYLKGQVENLQQDNTGGLKEAKEGIEKNLTLLISLGKKADNYFNLYNDGDH